MSFKDFFSKNNFLSNSLTTTLLEYKLKTEEKIREYIPTMGEKNTLREACEYALLNGGKRLRPSLVFMVAKALGYQSDVSFAALAIEMFHTASLVADDLPCMDNEEFRRGKPSLHKVYGESTAILVTFALISAAYDCLAKCGDDFALSNAPDADKNLQIARLAMANATRNSGLLGAAGGQFLDLNPPSLSKEVLCEVVQKKTVTFFEISFMFGWLFGGGDLKRVDLVKKTAAHFGMAFQIADDIGDIAQDKVNKCKVNFASTIGVEKAFKLFTREIEGFHKSLLNLNVESKELTEIASFITESVSWVQKAEYKI